MLAGHLGKLESSDERNTVARLSLEGPVGHQPLDEQILLQVATIIFIKTGELNRPFRKLLSFVKGPSMA
jgi:hypothetical protein